jgi:hypothetical protein
MRHVRARLLKAREGLDAAKQFWRDAMEEYDEEYAETLAALEQVHRKQIDDYDASFPEILPANFCKVSPRVLQLREQERQLILSKRFDDALPFREAADRLEHEELKAHRAKFLRTFRGQRQRLIEAQTAQKSCFNRKWDSTRVRIARARERELDALTKRVANFEAEVAGIEAEPDVASTRSTPRARPASAVAVRRGGNRRSVL